MVLGRASLVLARFQLSITGVAVGKVPFRRKHLKFEGYEMP